MMMRRNSNGTITTTNLLGCTYAKLCTTITIHIPKPDGWIVNDFTLCLHEEE